MFTRRESIFVALIILFCVIVPGSPVATQPIRPKQSPLRLRAPWSAREADGTRYGDTYCCRSDDCEEHENAPSWNERNCDENGHPGQGLWGAVDFFLTRYASNPDNKGGWQVRAAHNGEAKFAPLVGGTVDEDAVIVTCEEAGVRTAYNHVSFGESNGAVRSVKVGDVIGTVLGGGDTPHLMFHVQTKVNGNWKTVDIRDVELDGQPFVVESNPCPNYNVECSEAERFDIKFRPMIASAGLSQEMAGAESETGDVFGSALATGDFNGDKSMDLAVGLPSEDYADASGVGIVIVYYGSPGGFPLSGTERLGQGQVKAKVEAGDRFGASLAVGDFDGDGKDDLAVGVPGENDQATDDGMVTVFYGSPEGLLRSVGGNFEANKYERLGQVRSGGANGSGDQLGKSLVSGDFDGDGKKDLAAGSPGKKLSGHDRAGTVYVWPGSGGGFLR